MLQKNWMDLIKPSKMDVNVHDNDGRLGIIVAEPLERGFGLTLGNSIRRILLSSLQGAAIISIKIEAPMLFTILDRSRLIKTLFTPLDMCS